LSELKKKAKSNPKINKLLRACADVDPHKEGSNFCIDIHRDHLNALLDDADALQAAEAELAKHESELLRMEKCVRVAKRALTAIFTAGTDPDPPEVDPCESCVFPYVQKGGER
jgi:hypothetical protein